MFPQDDSLTQLNNLEIPNVSLNSTEFDEEQIILPKANYGKSNQKIKRHLLPASQHQSQLNLLWNFSKV